MMFPFLHSPFFKMTVFSGGFPFSLLLLIFYVFLTDKDLGIPSLPQTPFSIFPIGFMRLKLHD